MISENKLNLLKSELEKVSEKYFYNIDNEDNKTLNERYITSIIEPGLFATGRVEKLDDYRYQINNLDNYFDDIDIDNDIINPIKEGGSGIYELKFDITDELYHIKVSCKKVGPVRFDVDLKKGTVNANII